MPRRREWCCLGAGVLDGSSENGAARRFPGGRRAKLRWPGALRTRRRRLCNDSDTIEIHDQRIRLDGIDAPESSQLCVRVGAKERCGQAAALFLADMIGTQTVRCETHDVDRYGRDISTCWRGDVNINEAMVTAGQAVAYRKYSRAYVEAEENSRAAKLGILATEFEIPWNYRQNI